MVRIIVEHGDLPSRDTDVLVLAYPRVLGKRERRVLDAIGGVPSRSLPDVGHVFTRSHPHGINARALVVLGIPATTSISYEDVRQLGSAVVARVAEWFPTAVEVSTVLQSTGSGLDDAEVARAVISGMIDAVGAQRAGVHLERIVIVEEDPVRLDRIRRQVPAPLANFTEGPTQTPGPPAPPPRPRSRRRAFVAMPFARSWNATYGKAIEPAVTRTGLTCERMDLVHFTGSIVSTMLARIRDADVVIADISDANPNVYLEIGYAWGLSIPVILLLRQDSPSHFDVRGDRQLRYASDAELEAKLYREILGLGLGQSR